MAVQVVNNGGVVNVGKLETGSDGFDWEKHGLKIGATMATTGLTATSEMITHFALPAPVPALGASAGGFLVGVAIGGLAECVLQKFEGDCKQSWKCATATGFRILEVGAGTTLTVAAACGMLGLGVSATVAIAIGGIGLAVVAAGGLVWSIVRYHDRGMADDVLNLVLKARTGSEQKKEKEKDALLDDAAARLKEMWSRPSTGDLARKVLKSKMTRQEKEATIAGLLDLEERHPQLKNSSCVIL